MRINKRMEYVLVAATRRGFKMVLRPTAAATRGFTTVSFTEPVSRRNTFVGGKCTPPSALLVELWNDHDDEKSLMMRLAVSTEYRRMSDRRTSCDDIVRAMHSIAR